MNPERWQQVKEIFHSALTLDPRERAAFLERACAGHDSLRREVESLIRSHERTGNFIDAPAYEVAAEVMEESSAELQKGARLGPYEILSSLGRGGMGEVYLARDERLGRKVALKLLPAHFMKDRERLGRFEQEARAASSLNHPSILTIYEIGREDGKHFIATEFIEGETLRERIARGPLKAVEALDICSQIASALSAAHAAGIVHRDIKPENIMVREDRLVKILDFGLAKLTEERAPSDPEAATRAMVQTNSGVLMGTALYMSPEQARGLSVDARTDIWSLGVVLYEMLAGRAPFAGPTTSDVLVCILDKEPQPLAHLSSSEVPEALDWIVTKALTKEREDRYQTAREMLTDLRRLKQKLEHEADIERSLAPGIAPPHAKASSSGVVSTDGTRIERTALAEARPTLEAETPGGRSRLYKRVAFATLAVVAALFIVWAVRALFFKETRTGAPPAAAPSSAAGLNITRVTTWSGLDMQPGFSPDGNSIVYSSNHGGNFEIYIRQLAAGGSEVQLTSDGAQNFQPVWSPDGKTIAYYSRNRGGIWAVPAFGGVARQLTDFGSNPAWSPDGSQIAFQSDGNPDLGGSAIGSSTIWTVSAAGGTPQQVTKLGSPVGGHLGPSWSPAGKRLYFLSTDFLSSEIWSVSSGGGEVKFLLRGGVSDPYISPDGEHVYFTITTALWKVPVSAATGEKRGEPVLVADMGLARIRQLAISADGKKIAYSLFTETSNIVSIPVSPKTSEATGPPVALTNETGTRNMQPVFSPDGTKIAFTERHKGSNTDIWIIDADGKNRMPVTTEPVSNALPSWFPDGETIAYLSSREGRRKVFGMTIKSRKERLLLDLPGRDIQYARLSPDGRQLALNLADSNGIINVWTVPVEGGELKQLTFDKELAGFPYWSPDGRFIAFQFKRGDDVNLMVMPSTGGEPVQITFDKGLNWPHAWSPDGEKITFAGMRGGVWNIWWVTRDGKTEKQVTNFTKLNAYVRYPAWSPKGDQMVFESAESTGNIWIMDLK